MLLAMSQSSGVKLNGAKRLVSAGMVDTMSSWAALHMVTLCIGGDLNAPDAVTSSHSDTTFFFSCNCHRLENQYFLFQ